ncbi:MAG: hypothetical protein LBR73_00880 [Oscillospiraceae bacterium]|jgi:hypothetical protein|nr:hypothetical protein [Oscillospiraceae bacterium]
MTEWFSSIAQWFSTVFTLFCLSFTTLFGGFIPFAFANQTIEDIPQVLAIYQDIAAKNTDTRFSVENSKPVVEFSGTNWNNTMSVTATMILKAFVKGGVKEQETIAGVPGLPAQILASDIAYAKAVYYDNGKEVVLTIVPKDVRDTTGDDLHTFATMSKAITKRDVTPETMVTNLKALNADLEITKAVNKNTGYLLGGPYILVRADTATGKITNARYQMGIITTVQLAVIGIPVWIEVKQAITAKLA